jgi:hypothetical protein
MKQHLTKILIVGLVVVMLGIYIDTPKTSPGFSGDGATGQGLLYAGKYIGLGIVLAGACIGLGLAARKGGDE